MMTFEITVGRLLCRHIREYLEKCKFKGYEIEWIESSGFIEREFVIKGDPIHVEPVAKDLERWAYTINSEEES